MALEVNSVPWSKTMTQGVPRRAMIAFSARDAPTGSELVADEIKRPAGVGRASTMSGALAPVARLRRRRTDRLSAR